MDLHQTWNAFFLTTLTSPPGELVLVLQQPWGVPQQASPHLETAPGTQEARACHCVVVTVSTMVSRLIHEQGTDLSALRSVVCLVACVASGQRKLSW